VKAAAEDLANQVQQWKAGTSSRSQVVSAATTLLQTVRTQASAAATQTAQDLAAVGTALSELLAAITAGGGDSNSAAIDKAKSDLSSAANQLGNHCPG
jgi:hypothetical protein